GRTASARAPGPASELSAARTPPRPRAAPRCRPPSPAGIGPSPPPAPATTQAAPARRARSPARAGRLVRRAAAARSYGRGLPRQPPTRRPGNDRSPSRPVLVGLREFPNQGVQRAAEAEQRSEDREDAVGASLAVHPLPHEDRDQDGDGQLDPEPGVAERSRAFHGAKLRACEKFRKQRADRANLCCAWEYDMLTWIEHAVQPFPSPAPRPSAA